MVDTQNAIASLYSGHCNIINQSQVKDAVTKQTSLADTVVVSNQPCRLSYKTFVAADQGSGAAVKKQVIKLFCSPNTPIIAGAKVVVTQNGVTKTYKAAGEPAVYSGHLEIELLLEGDYA